MKGLVIVILMLFITFLEAVLVTAVHGGGMMSILFGLCDIPVAIWLSDRIEFKKD